MKSELTEYKRNECDKYGNPLVSDAAFMAGYKGGLNYLNRLLKFFTFDKLKQSNQFIDNLIMFIEHGINDYDNDYKNDLNPENSMTYQDYNEIIGAITGEAIDTAKDWRKAWTGKKYEEYLPKELEFLRETKEGYIGGLK